jgi:signal transduction histidine kinase
VSKHADARHVSVELQVGDGTATLRIGDDGKGFDVDRYRRTPTLWGVGLLGMRERVAYHGGRIDIRSRPRRGVTIVLSIPIADDALRTPPADDTEPRGSRPPARPRSSASA